MRQLFVAGGGSAGVKAAIAGLEEGVKATLVEASYALPAPRSGGCPVIGVF